MYGEDSFFTLGVGGRTGLVAVSVAMMLGLAIATRQIACRVPWGVRILPALALFWLFLWLSPQVYYTYYWLIFDGLPAQWQIGPPPALDWLARLVAFSDAATLSAHGKGGLAWGLIGIALWPVPQRSELTEP